MGLLAIASRIGVGNAWCSLRNTTPVSRSLCNGVHNVGFVRFNETPARMDFFSGVGKDNLASASSSVSSMDTSNDCSSGKAGISSVGDTGM